MTAEPLDEPRVQNIEGCPACHGEHEASFWLNHAHPRWIGMCPVEGEPLSIVLDSDGKETIVAIETYTPRGLSGAFRDG